MPFAEAATTYTVLTIGDGLVSQIPALIISTSAGIIVSRAAGDMSLGQEFMRQFSMQPKALAIAGGIIFAFGLVPGLPHISFMILGTGVCGLSYFIIRANKQILRQEMEAAAKAETMQLQAPPPPGPEQVEALLPLDLMELGGGLRPDPPGG